MTTPPRILVAYGLPLIGTLSTYLLADSGIASPYIWAAALWLVVCSVEMAIARQATARALWLAGATATVVLGGYESWLQAAKPQAGTYSESYLHGGYMRLDELFGYGPTPGIRIESSLRVGDKTVYDVVYTIGEDGLRVTPGSAEGTGRDCILYFGGSFTFGEGVDDDQTLPARVSVETGGRLRMRNFGFHGYGPHHMLVALESGFVERTAGCRPDYIIVQTAVWHAKRVIGATTWDDSGPRYVLDTEGHCVRVGKFSDLDRAWSRRVLDLLERSLVFETKLAPLFDRRHRNPGPRDLDLYVGIIATARDRAAALYPTAEFHVLLWDMQPEEELATLRRRFADRGLRVHSVRAVLAAGGTDPYDPKWTLDAGDEHPSTKAYEALGKYVASEIVKR